MCHLRSIVVWMNLVMRFIGFCEPWGNLMDALLLSSSFIRVRFLSFVANHRGDFSVEVMLGLAPRVSSSWSAL